MLEARKIVKTHGHRIILDSVNLHLERGEKIALFGLNGSGKSTLARILAGVEYPNSGEILVDDEILYHAEYERRRVGLVLQNPEEMILTTEVRRELAFPLEFLNVEQDKIHRRIEQCAANFGLSDFLDKSPDELSGGMIARVALASVVITGPDFIILDEPSSYLDYVGKKLFFDSIMKLEKTGIILITQNPRFAKWADRCLSLRDGKLTEVEKNDHIFAKYEKDANASNIVAKESSDIDTDTILKATGLSFSYSDDRVLSKIDMRIRKSSCIALLGRSGCGKSTLLCLLARLLKPDSGKIEGDAKTGMILQFPQSQLFERSVLEDVAFGPKNFGLTNPYELAKSALAKMEIPEEFYETNPFLLSEGEKRRVGIAGVIASEPEILILDEPSASLDKNGIDILISLIEEYMQNDRAVIMVTHDIEFVERVADRVLVLHQTEKIFDGTIADLFHNRDKFEKWGIGSLFGEI